MIYDLGALPLRILDRIDVADGCWLWLGRIDKEDGYGRIDMPSADGHWRPKIAHRVVYELLIGPVPDGLQLDHVRANGCVNRHCVNVFEHLEPVTCRTNLLRGDGPSGQHARKTHCPRGHDFTEANTRVVGGQRKCRACVRARQYERKMGKPHPTGGATPLRVTKITRDLGIDVLTI